MRLAVVPVRRVAWALVALYCAAMYTFLLGLFWLLTSLSEPVGITGPALALPAVGIILLFVFAQALTSPFSRPMTLATIGLRDALARGGLVLEKLPHGHRRWDVRVGLAFICTFFGSGIATVLYAAPGLAGAMQPSSQSIGWTLLAGAIAVCGAVLVVFAFFVARRIGAGDRFTPAIPTLNFVLGLCLFLASPLCASLLGKLDRDLWNQAFRARDWVACPQAFGSEQPVSPANAVFGVRLFRLLVLLCLGAGALLWTLAGFFFVKSLRSLDLVVALAGVLRTKPEAGDVRAATSGRDILGFFRVTLVLSWTTFGALVLGGILLTTWCTWTELVRGSELPATGKIGFTGGVGLGLDFLLGSAPGTHVVLVRWLAAGLSTALVVAIVASVGSLLLRWRTAGRTLHSQSNAEALEKVNAAASPLASLMIAHGRRVPGITIVDAETPFAGSTTTARFRPLVLVSTKLVKLLDPAELRAILAHECAHHWAGDVRRHSVLQFLGRLTLFGDAFVGVLEDSFEYELRADRLAISLFSTPPDTLCSALVKIHASSIAHAGQCERTSRGSRGLLAAAAMPPGTAITAVASFTQRWRGRVVQWLRVYTSDSAMSYWHPSISDRIVRLRRMCVS